MSVYFRVETVGSATVVAWWTALLEYVADGGVGDLTVKTRGCAKGAQEHERRGCGCEAPGTSRNRNRSKKPK